jgi:two-component system cell cycle response regulator DivK
MPFTVLYIEDNPDSRILVQRVLESRNYRFIWAANGLDGIKKAIHEKPDAILLDINLPDIDGYEVARKLRGETSNQLMYIPIIAITANALRGDAEKALAAGCDMYLSKPIDIRDLWARIEEYLPAE